MGIHHIFAVFVSLLPTGADILGFGLNLMDAATNAMTMAVVAEIWRRYDAGRKR